MSEEPRRDGAGGFDRIPPNDIEAERYVLGSMMLSREAITDVADLLGDDDFYRPAHSMIWSAAMDLFGRNEPVDPVTVADVLAKRGELDRTGGGLYLHECTARVMTARNVSYYAHIVRNKATLRHLVEVSAKNLADAYAGIGEVTDIVTSAQSAVQAVGLRTISTDYVRADVVMYPLLDSIEANENRPDGLTGLATGYADFDALTNGMQPGQMIIVAARPAMGKSTCAVDAARHVSIANGKVSIIFSLEMSRDEIMLRILAAEAGVKLQDLRSGQLKDADWQKIGLAAARIADAPLYIDDSPNMSMPEIRAKAHRLKATVGLDFMGLDYVQLMSGGASSKGANRQEEVSGYSRGLKLLAKELAVPMMVLSQLNRGPEQRGDKKPLMSDLRESGALEQDADIIMLLHREDAYDPDNRPGEADFIIAKHRNGATKTITVAFQGHYSRFMNMFRGAEGPAE